MPVFACGSNQFGQIQPDKRDDVVAVDSFAPWLPLGSDVSRPNEVIAVSASQVLWRDEDAKYHLAGFWDAAGTEGKISELAMITSQLQQHVPKRVLGKGTFSAWLDIAGRLRSFSGPLAASRDAYIDADMDSHGRVLAILEDSKRLVLYANLNEALSGETGENAIISAIPPQDLTQARVTAGGAHFIIRTIDNGVYGLGDNRHFQQGHPGRSSWSQVAPVSFFEGGAQVVKVAAGNIHTVFLTSDGAAYCAGSNADGQCGGDTEQEPTLVELSGSTGGGMDEETVVDVLDAGCGTTHTCLLTSIGVYTAGSNHVGQLGIGSRDPCPSFIKATLPSTATFTSVVAAGWSTFIQSEINGGS